MLHLILGMDVHLWESAEQWAVLEAELSAWWLEDLSKSKIPVWLTVDFNHTKTEDPLTSSIPLWILEESRRKLQLINLDLLGDISHLQ